MKITRIVTHSLLAISLIFGLSIYPVYAASKKDIGTRTGNFLKLGAGARAIGMGETGGALAEDSSVMYWNPAGLTQLPSSSLTLMHSVYLDSIFYDYLAYAIPTKKYGGFGVSVQYLSIGDLDQTEDNTGLKIGTFAPKDMVVTMGYACPLGIIGLKNLSLGGAVKYISSELKDKSSTVALDMGLLYSLKNLRLGISAQNLLGRLKYDQTAHQLPENWRASSSLRIGKRLLVALDVNAPKDNGVNFGVGGEYIFFATGSFTTALRLGYNNLATEVDGLNGFRFGFGGRWKRMGIDYAIAPMGNLGLTHRISLTYK